MPRYTVPITRKWIDVYEVDAKSPTEAGIKVGRLLAEEAEPKHKSEVGMSVGPAKLVIADDDQSEEADPG